jgi:fatty acid desaturase
MMKRRRADPLYLELCREVAAAGYFTKDPWGYALRAAGLLALFTTAYVVRLCSVHPLLVGGCLLVLAQTVTQLAYLAHDAGHRAICNHRRLALFIGHFGMTFLTGFGFSWWMHSHDNHHAVLNEREHDLAMKYSLVLAVHQDAARGKRGLRRRLLRWQGHYVWLLMPFYHFAMMWDAVVWIARNPRTTRIDQLVLPLYVILWFVIPAPFLGLKVAALHWLAESMIASVYLVLTFIVHHVGKKVILPADEATMTLLRQQLETTRTIKTWRIWDWYYSGLNYHIEHHLFPWVPHWRYRRMRLVVQGFCRRKGLTYREQGFWSAWWEVVTHLRRVGRSQDGAQEGAGSAAAASAASMAASPSRYEG